MARQIASSSLSRLFERTTVMPERAPPATLIKSSRDWATRIRQWRQALLGVLGCLILLGSGAPAAQAVPAEFWGLSAGFYLESEATWADMQSLGIRQFRLQFAEGGPGSEVSSADPYVLMAARHGITILPYLYATSSTGARYPRKGTAEYDNWLAFVRRFVQRYGVNGSFWSVHPELSAHSMRVWEVWNEPNREENNPIMADGRRAAQPHHFAQFLIDTSAVIRSTQAAIAPASPATVVLGGLDSTARSAPHRAPRDFLRALYEPVTNDGVWGSHTTAEVRAAFDGLGLHPYAFADRNETRFALLQERTREGRNALNEQGDSGKPLWITEIGWAVRGGNLPPGEPLNVSDQAAMLTRTMSWFRDQSETLNIDYVAWYFYRDVSATHPACDLARFGSCWQNHAGLRDVDGNARESWCRYSRIIGTNLCGFDTQAYTRITQTLNGQPGFVSIEGEVLITNGEGQVVNGARVNINFERETGGGNYSYVDTARADVINGHYEYKFWAKGVGRWRMRAVLPAQPPYNQSRPSGYHRFQIKSGYRLVARHSGKCLSLSGNNAANGTPIIQWDCSPNPVPWDGQVIHLVPIEAAGQYYNIKINSTGKCVDVPGVSLADGAKLQEWDCLGAGQTNQHWRVVPIAGQPPYEAFIARHSGKCMDVEGRSTANGARIHQWSCHWMGNQQWSWQAIE